MQGEPPPKVRPTQWLTWAVLQAWFTPCGIYAYVDMTSPRYNIGNWALVVAVPCVVLPTLYGAGLVWQQKVERPRYERKVRERYARASSLSPTCDICGTNPSSWNTRTSSWMETCSSCRGNKHPDSGYMIG